jgi:putative endonuclease
MFHTYILYSATLNKFYIGQTGDELNIRLQKHLTDHDGYTAKAKDWITVWSKHFENKSLAYAMERTIKGWKSRKMIQQLIDKHSSTSSGHPDL